MISAHMILFDTQGIGIGADGKSTQYHKKMSMPFCCVLFVSVLPSAPSEYMYILPIWNRVDSLAQSQSYRCPDSKIYGAIMGPTLVLPAPDGPQFVPMNLAIRLTNVSEVIPRNIYSWNLNKLLQWANRVYTYVLLKWLNLTSSHGLVANNQVQSCDYPDSKVHRANMGPIWGRQEPGGPHVGPMTFAIWVATS